MKYLVFKKDTEISIDLFTLFEMRCQHTCLSSYANVALIPPRALIPRSVKLFSSSLKILLIRTTKSIFGNIQPHCPRSTNTAIDALTRKLTRPLPPSTGYSFEMVAIR